MTINIRAYRADDLDALYAICLKSGNAGQDATALHRYPELPGAMYSAPYATFEPQHVLVAEDDAGVAGYIVGTFDTRRYTQILEEQWWPDWRRRFPAPVGPASEWTPDEKRIAAMHAPGNAPDDIIDAYPAHIHMNLLPRLQGGGIGTSLLSGWIGLAIAARVRGIHLGASLLNHRALGFWHSRGFEKLRIEGAQWFGMDLAGALTQPAALAAGSQLQESGQAGKVRKVLS